MKLLCDTEDDTTIGNSMRAVVVGDYVIDAALNDQTVWEWLEEFLARVVVDADDREMLDLPPLPSPVPRASLKQVK
jgi:hypothetical protein